MITETEPSFTKIRIEENSDEGTYQLLVIDPFTTFTASISRDEFRMLGEILLRLQLTKTTKDNI